MLSEDVDVIFEMERTGGSFVKALGNAAMRADSANLSRIKAAFPEYWAIYSQRAQRRRASKETEC